MKATMERTLVTPILAEFKEEVAITRRVLERVPSDGLAWKPHPKSMTLGQLAWHVASVPATSRLLQADSFDVTQGNFVPPQPNSVHEILEAFENNVRTAEGILQEMDDARLEGEWRLMKKERQIFVKPRIAVLRTILLNHWYHHRGQLSVYLRLLDIPLPVIYGRSADEDPFA